MNLNEELREKIYLLSLWGALVLALMVAFLSYAYNNGFLNFSFGLYGGDEDALAMAAVLGIIIVFHIVLLRFMPFLTTRSARLVGRIIFVAIPICFFFFLARPSWDDLTALIFSFKDVLMAFQWESWDYYVIFCLLTFFLWYPGLVAYSIPSSFMGLFPLLLHYFFFLLILLSVRDGRIALVPSILFLAYFPMAGYCFPKHRRLREFWKPARLPRIRRHRQGVTLIELLIVVALIAIMATLLVNLHGNTRRLLERQTDWRAAVALAEEEFDLLRARGDLPVPGRYPVDPALFGHFPFAEQAEVEVRPGPGERLREVQVHVRLRGDANDHDITLAAILPIPVGRREARP